MPADFLNKDNIIFFGVLGLIFLVAAVICFIIIRIFIKLIINIFKKIFKKIFHKEEIKRNAGAGLKAVASDAEENKIQQAEAGGQKTTEPSASGPKLDYSNYPEKPEEKELEKTGKQKYEEKEQKDIASGLEKLKGEEEKKTSFLEQQGDTENNGPGPKIEIPVARKFGQDKAFASQSAGANITAKAGNAGYGQAVAPNQEKKGNAPQSPAKSKNEASVPGKTSVMQTNRLENLRGSDVKINNGNIGKSILPEKARQKQSGGGSPESSLMFGEGEEVPRTQLRQKLRSAKFYQAEKQVGLTLSPIERAKLEKQVFSPVLGYNISKSDLKTSIRKLNQKMLGTKDPQVHEKIRKEIKFFKKIGGVK